MNQVFRPIVFAWLEEVALSLIIFVGLFFMLWPSPSTVKTAATDNLRLAMISLGFIYIVWRDWLPLFRGWVAINEGGIAGCIKNSEFKITWPEIEAASFDNDKHQPVMNLHTGRGSYSLPLRQFDAAQIWSLVSARVAPAALAPDAYQNTPRRREWLAAAIEKAALLEKPLRVSPGFVKVTGWVGLLLCVPLFTNILLSRQWLAAFLLLPFAMLGVYLILASGPIEMDGQTVSYITPLGIYRIAWDEVTRAEMDSLGGEIVLHAGPDKRLVILGPGYWSGREKQAMYELFQSRLESGHTPFTVTRSPIMSRSKNVKVKRNNR